MRLDALDLWDRNPLWHWHAVSLSPYLDWSAQDRILMLGELVLIYS